ncbi:MAG TPA: thermonuclease family protein [Syntrophales bacterium]|nr:thermonuclease family protein [Syntrophales bacterium]HPQ43804.1 thermonuclease family protein [Syntrophales bacterium]
MKIRLQIISLLFVLIVSLPVLAVAAHYKVIRVVDGDTIVIDYQGAPEKVRLLCVNTPESVHPDKKQNVPMGTTASQYTKKRLSGKYVDLQFEGARTRGTYGRLLTYVFIDGENLNLELVREGLSPYYTKYGISEKYDKDFKEAERFAREHHLNIWGDAALTAQYLRLKSKWGLKQSVPDRTTQNYQIVAQSDAGPYVGSDTSNRFHRPSCHYAGRIRSEHRIYFESRADAQRYGYIPCSVCCP